MKYCKYCGAELKDEAIFCTTCGQNQSNGGSVNVESTVVAQKSQSNVWWTVLGFLIPIVALILWAVWKDSEPEKALAVGKGGLMMVCFSHPIVGLIVYLVMKENYPDIAKACGICALIGVGISALSILFVIAIYVIMIIGMAASSMSILPALLLL